MAISRDDAHDLNNLLVYVVLGLELIEHEISRDAVDRERLRALVKDALDGAEKVRALVRDRRAAPAPPPKKPPAQRKRVLLLDDEPRLAPTLATGLADSAEIVAVHTGAEALQRLDGGFDLVLCDLALPDLCGIDVFEQAPAELRDRFVFMSGGAKDDRARDFLAQHRRLDKPFRLEEVEALLR